MKCPRCGADNSEHAATCYLCDYAFGGDAGAGGPTSPDEAFRAQHLPPEAAPRESPPQGRAVPPPPVAGTGAYQPPPPGAFPGGYQPPPPGAYSGGYQPPPPGAYPGGYQPTAPAPKGPNTVKVVIGVLVVVLVVVVGVGAYLLTRGETYDIVFSTPPGYQEADQEMIEDIEEAMGSGSEEIVIDGFFLDAGSTNSVIVAHLDTNSIFGTDAPSGDDPEEMEEWFYGHEQEQIDEFNSGIMQGVGHSGEIDLYEVERMATGDAVLHMTASIDVMGTTFMMDSLFIIKERTAFLIMFQGSDSGKDTLEFFKDTVTFE